MKERKPQVSDVNVQAAIRKFMAAGGIITKLPDEKTSASRMVGRRWNTSEVAGESH